jgi:hypothetical protein
MAASALFDFIPSLPRTSRWKEQSSNPIYPLADFAVLALFRTGPFATDDTLAFLPSRMLLAYSDLFAAYAPILRATSFFMKMSASARASCLVAKARNEWSTSLSLSRTRQR